MKPDTKVKSPHQKEALAGESAQVVENSPKRPRSVGENIFLTLKILAGFAVMGAALWGLDAWTNAR